MTAPTVPTAPLPSELPPEHVGVVIFEGDNPCVYWRFHFDRSSGHSVKVWHTPPAGTKIYSEATMSAMRRGLAKEVKELTSMMDNVLAWRLGQAALGAAAKPGGDYIDTGLMLLKLLNEKGFDVVVKDKL